MRTVFTFFKIIGLVGLIGFAGCESNPTSTPGATKSAPSSTGKTNQSLTGSIKIEGSSTVGPISMKAKEMFNADFPKVNISVGEQGTSNGFSSFAKKEADIADASRPIKANELEQCRKAGVTFFELPIAYDGLTFVVNKENTFCKQLTIDQLKKIFRKDMAAKTWKDVDPSWPDEKISVYAPGIQSGTHDYCIEILGKKDNVGMRSDEQITLSEDDKQLVTGVSGDKFSIGFFGFSYFESSKLKLNAVAIVNSAGNAVVPSVESIEDGSYEPFSRPLFLYVNEASYQRAEVAEFIGFYLKNVGEIVAKSGYVPLGDSVNKISQSTLDFDQAGTRFVKADGTSVSGSLSEILAGPVTK